MQIRLAKADENKNPPALPGGLERISLFSPSRTPALVDNNTCNDGWKEETCC
jgi:hypothetical protein